MAESKATMTVRRANDVASVIDIEGEITGLAETALMDAYNKATMDGVSNVILNFGGLDYMNSGGIGLLIMLLIQANRQSQRLMAIGVNDHYRHIFELTKIDEAIHIFDSESQALLDIGN